MTNQFADSQKFKDYTNQMRRLTSEFSGHLRTANTALPDQTIGTRLVQLRETRKINQSQLAEIVSVSRETVVRWENDNRVPKDSHIQFLAEFYGVPERWIRYGGAGRPTTVPVMGHVGAGAQVKPFYDGPFEEIETPFGTPPDTVALVVRGDSMMPELSDGDYVLYRAMHQNPDDCIGKRCIVELLDGTVLVKRLRRSSQPGLYDLDSTNAATLANQSLIWVAKVEAVKYR